MGKGGNAGYQHFLLFSQCFKNAVSPEMSSLCAKGLSRHCTMLSFHNSLKMALLDISRGKKYLIMLVTNISFFFQQWSLLCQKTISNISSRFNYVDRNSFQTGQAEIPSNFGNS